MVDPGWRAVDLLPADDLLAAVDTPFKELGVGGVDLTDEENVGPRRGGDVGRLTDNDDWRLGGHDGAAKNWRKTKNCWKIVKMSMAWTNRISKQDIIVIHIGVKLMLKLFANLFNRQDIISCICIRLFRH